VRKGEPEKRSREYSLWSQERKDAQCGQSMRTQERREVPDTQDALEKTQETRKTFLHVSMSSYSTLAQLFTQSLAHSRKLVPPALLYYGWVGFSHPRSLTAKALSYHPNEPQTNIFARSCCGCDRSCGCCRRCGTRCCCGYWYWYGTRRAVGGGEKGESAEEEGT
jgi:hypothetical protein